MAEKDKERNISEADRVCPALLSSRESIVNPENLTKLEPGQMVGKNWKVLRAIEADMGINKIFIVEHEKKKYRAAMKMEPKKLDQPLLKFELFVLLQMEKSNKAKHMCKVFDRGAEPEYNYIIISLCGKNLKQLRKEREFAKLSLPCGLSVGMQCLAAIQELHKLGFIHRAVNPSDFAIGRVQEENSSDLRNIYLLDFMFSHQYRNKDGTHKPPRKEPWKYFGSARHAARNAFLVREFGRCDDLEMWFYMLVELVRGSLPWVHQRDPKLVFEYQKAVRNGLPMREFLGGLPVEFLEIMKEIDKLAYTDEPKYSDINALLKSAMDRCGKPEFPYDWEEVEIAAAKEGSKKEEPKEAEEKK